MKAVVLDSNIFFSSLRSKKSILLQQLEKRGETTVFYTPNFLVVEIFKHRERLRAKSKLTEDEFVELLHLLFREVRLFSETMISANNLYRAWLFVRDVDPKDHLFVALALELDAELWTHDQVLKSGLLKKGFDRFFSETE
jgi:predicted nucleic acid-binding protein